MKNKYLLYGLLFLGPLLLQVLRWLELPLSTEFFAYGFFVVLLIDAILIITYYRYGKG